MTTSHFTFSQVALSLISDGVGSVNLACALGYTSTALLSMERDSEFEITEKEGSWIGATVPGAALIGSLLARILLESLGRVSTLKLIALPSALTWLCIAYATSAWQVIAARTISGLCLGIQQVAAAVYASEMLHSELKPKFAMVPGLTMMAGFILINIVGSISGWREMAWVSLYVNGLFLLLILVLPETPYFLLKSGKKEKSFQIMKWLRATEEEALSEFQELSETEASKKAKHEPTLMDMLKPPYRWPFLVAILLHIFQQGTGISTITTFTGIIFEKSGCDIDLGLSSVITTIGNIGVIIIVGQQMGKYPRKKFINVSSLVMICSLLILAFHIYVTEQETSLQNLFAALSYLPFVCFFFFMIGFGIGWGPIPWMFIGDSLPLEIRGSGSGMIIATNWAFSFLSTKTFSWTIGSMGHHNVYLLYASFTLLGMMIMNYQIPETFGFSDIKLQKYYEDSYKPKRL